MKIEFVKNIDLLENNFKHILYELKDDNISFFRIAREYHQALSRTMVEVLYGFPEIKKRGSLEKFEYTKAGANSPWFEIHKIKITKENKVWRYSQPKEKIQKANEQSDKNIDKNSLENLSEEKMRLKIVNNYIEELSKTERHLKDFYLLLALIQTKYFSNCFNRNKMIEITDEEMLDLEFLHENIRNEYEHFSLGFYGNKVDVLVKVSGLCSNIIKKLLLESVNVGALKLPEKIIECDELLNKIN